MPATVNTLAQNYDIDLILPDLMTDEMADTPGGDPLLDKYPLVYEDFDLIKYNQWENGYGLLGLRGLGSCGADQFDVYDDGTSNNQPGVARAALKYDHLTEPGGAQVTEQGAANPGANALAYVSGHFNTGDLSGLDAAALSDPGFRLVAGAAITDPGAVVAIGC